MNEEDPLLTRPKSIKGLGVLHLVFGVLTILTSLFGLVMQPFMAKIYKGLAEGAKTEQERLQIELQLKLQEETGLYNLISNGGMLVLAIILVVAGLMLLKSKRSGRSLSVSWSWLALLATGIWLALCFTMLVPKMPELIGASVEQGIEEGGAGLSEEEKEKILEQTSTFVTAFTAIVFVVLALLACIYPVITLVLLKKKAVREWMEAHGT